MNEWIVQQNQHRNMFKSPDITSRPFRKRRQAKSLASADSRTVGDDIRLKFSLWDHLQHVQRKLPLLGFFTGTFFWESSITWTGNWMMMEISVIPSETSYESTVYHFQPSQGLDAAHMLMFTGPLLCVCLLSERNIKQQLKSGHHISVQHFNFNSTRPMSNWQHICATPAQPLHRVLKIKCQRWKKRLWGKKSFKSCKQMEGTNQCIQRPWLKLHQAPGCAGDSGNYLHLHMFAS